MTALNVQKPCKKSPFPRNNHNLWNPRRMVLLSILEAKEITSKKTKDKKLSTQEKKRKSFSRTVTGRALPRSASVAPLRRRLLDRGLLLEALRLRQRGRDQSHRRATNGARSHRTIAGGLWAPSHTALPITFTHVGWPCQSFSTGAETRVFLASNKALWYEGRVPKLQSPKSQAYVLTYIWVLSLRIRVHVLQLNCEVFVLILMQMFNCSYFIFALEANTLYISEMNTLSTNFCRYFTGNWCTSAGTITWFQFCECPYAAKHQENICFTLFDAAGGFRRVYKKWVRRFGRPYTKSYVVLRNSPIFGGTYFFVLRLALTAPQF